MKSKKSLSSNSSWLFADLCFLADKHSESPGHTSAWCCWMRWGWTENASLPPWRRMSCSPTSIASCWTKRNEKGWKSTETSVTDLIKPLQLPWWQTDHYCQHKMKRDDRPETRPWGILAGESGGGGLSLKCGHYTLKCRHFFLYIQSSAEKTWRPENGPYSSREDGWLKHIIHNFNFYITITCVHN